MSLSSIIKKTCPTCNKVAIESDRYSFGDATIVQLVCGHSIVEETLTISNYDTVISSDGRSLMPFQVTGVKFAEKANARVLIADEQGLGKTIQAIAMLKLHPELLPAVITCKTSLKAQWFHEIIRWTGGKDSYLTQVIGSSKEKPIPYAFGIYIITYDILKTEGLFDSIGIKTVILDECQAIKNHLSGRAKAVQSVAKDAEHIIALSGTPIKNHAGEYFTILNLLQPSRFPEFNRFLRDDCDSYETMYGYKVGGLARPDEFREKTQDFIIRRTQKEVLPDLPELNRQFYHVELDRRLNKAYADGLAELDDLLYSEENENTMTSMIAIMTKLRKITGISKVTEAVDFVTEFLLNTDRKIVVFAHHHDAVNLLDASLSKWLSDGGFKKPLNLHAGLNGEARAELVKKFQSEDYRIMIASTLAAGEGLNLQFCSDAIMLERQWNPANEEQAEKRFHRIGTKNSVNIYYFIASETIDEYFTELVEAKRAIIKGTLDNEAVQWDQQGLLKELAGILVQKGKGKWKL